MKNRALAIAVLVGALIGLVVGIGISPLIYSPRVETHTFTTTATATPSTLTTTVTASRTPQKVLFWEGKGAGPDTALVTFEDYHELRLELLKRLGPRLIEVGLREGGGMGSNRWIVLLQDLSLAADDIAFIRGLFPGRVSLQIVGERDCEVRILQTLPPIVQVIC